MALFIQRRCWIKQEDMHPHSAAYSVQSSYIIPRCMCSRHMHNNSGSRRERAEFILFCWTNDATIGYYSNENFILSIGYYITQSCLVARCSCIYKNTFTNSSCVFSTGSLLSLTVRHVEDFCHSDSCGTDCDGQCLQPGETRSRCVKVGLELYNVMAYTWIFF